MSFSLENFLPPNLTGIVNLYSGGRRDLGQHSFDQFPKLIEDEYADRLRQCSVSKWAVTSATHREFNLDRSPTIQGLDISPKQQRMDLRVMQTFRDVYSDLISFNRGYLLTKGPYPENPDLHDIRGALESIEERKDLILIRFFEKLSERHDGAKDHFKYLGSFKTDSQSILIRRMKQAESIRSWMRDNRSVLTGDLPDDTLFPKEVLLWSNLTVQQIGVILLQAMKEKHFDIIEAIVQHPQFSWIDMDLKGQMLIAAAENGHLVSFNALLNQLHDLIHPHHLGSALIRGVKNRQWDCVNALLDKAKNRIYSEDLEEALGWAASTDLPCFKALLDKAKDLIRGPQLGLALKKAVESGQLSCVNAILDKEEGQINSYYLGEALQMAAEKENILCIEALLDKVQDRIDRVDLEVALEWAATKRNLNCIKKLLKVGEDRISIDCLQRAKRLATDGKVGVQEISDVLNKRLMESRKIPILIGSLLMGAIGAVAALYMGRER